ncbi:MAG: response regulator [Actinobacteria bacterium]|nr:response regulator [Actinomycetota bacterium]
MKIIIAEKDRQTVKTITTSLRRRWPEATVTPSDNGESTLRLFRQQCPEVVLLGVNLPGKDGFQLLQEIRRLSDATVVMLAEREDEAEQIQALDLGADAYIAKPFRHTTIVSRINSMLRRRAWQRTTSSCGDTSFSNGRNDREDE